MVVALVTAMLNLGAAVLRLLETERGRGCRRTASAMSAQEGAAELPPPLMSPPLAEGAGEPSGCGERG